MSFIIRPWQIFLLGLSGWINRQQQDMIEYLITEYQILKEKLGKKRILLNDDQCGFFLFRPPCYYYSY